jgi:hypothetical protein
MGANRISVAGLLGLVAVIAIGIASLRFATVAWTTAATTVTVGVLLAAVLGVIYLRGAARAFCVGFALFGWVYLILVDWSWIGAQVGHDLTGGLGDLAEVVHPAETPRLTAAFGPMTGQTQGQRNALRLASNIAQAGQITRSQQRYIMIGNFVAIGRLVLALAFAFAGGVTARALASRGEAAHEIPR